MTSAFRTATLGKSDLPVCRMRRKRATSSFPTTRCASSSPPPTGIDDKFGLLTDTLAVTGARPSQAVRLRVEDLHDHPVRPKLMMPKSAKGGDRNRAEKKLERYSVPITVQLAARLKAAAKGRADHAPLLLQGDGSPGPTIPAQAIIARSRRSSPTSAPILTRRCTRSGIRRSCGCCCETCRSGWWRRCTTPSTKMIEKHYSKFITEHSDDVSRHALLQPESPVGENVVALRRESRAAATTFSGRPCTYSLKLG